MKIIVCKNCRRLFKYIHGPELCQECIKLLPNAKIEPSKKENTFTLKPMLKEEEEKYIQVKDYIMTHAKETIAQISEANDILPKKLFEWIREERLQFSEDSNAWFECEKCGAKIKSGKLCNRCKNR